MSTRRWITAVAISVVLGAAVGLTVAVVAVATAPQARRPVGTMTAGPAIPRSLP